MNQVVSVDLSSIPGAGYGAWSTTTIPANTVFGPNNVDSDIDIDESDSLIPKIKREVPEYKPDIQSIWMRHINCARNKTEENLIAFYQQGALFYRVPKTIPAKSELLVDNCKRSSCWKKHLKLPSSKEENKLADSTENKPPISAPTENKPPISAPTENKPSISAFECDDTVATSDKHPLFDILQEECEICAERFMNKNRLAVHMRKHKARKSHKCKECGKIFSRADHFKAHQRIHSGEKPYKCDVCKKSFRQGSDLRKHKKIHTGEKPHNCGDCGKSFSQLSNLRRHMTMHIEEKPHECDTCGKCFSDWSYLRKHIRIHTRSPLNYLELSYPEQSTNANTSIKKETN